MRFKLVISQTQLCFKLSKMELQILLNAEAYKLQAS